MSYIIFFLFGLRCITIFTENFIYNIVVVHQSVFIFLNSDKPAKVIETFIALEVVASALNKNNYIVMYIFIKVRKDKNTLMNYNNVIY